MYNPPPLSEFVGGMTKEFGGSYITEYVTNGPNLRTMHIVQATVYMWSKSKFHINHCGLLEVDL